MNEVHTTPVVETFSADELATEQRKAFDYGLKQGRLLAKVRPDSFDADYPDGGILFVRPLRHRDAARKACEHYGTARYVVIGLSEDEDNEDKRIDKVMLPTNVWPGTVANIDRAIAALQAAREALS